MRGLQYPDNHSEIPFIATRGYDSVVWSRLYSRDISGLDEYQIDKVRHLCIWKVRKFSRCTVNDFVLNVLESVTSVHFLEIFTSSWVSLVLFYFFIYYLLFLSKNSMADFKK